MTANLNPLFAHNGPFDHVAARRADRAAKKAAMAVLGREGLERLGDVSVSGDDDEVGAS